MKDEDHEKGAPLLGMTDWVSKGLSVKKGQKDWPQGWFWLNTVRMKVKNSMDFIEINNLYLAKHPGRGWRDKLQTEIKYLQTTYPK